MHTPAIGAHVVFLNGDVKNSHCGRIIEIKGDMLLVGITKSINHYQFHDAAWLSVDDVSVLGDFSINEINLARTMAMFEEEKIL